MGVRVNGCLFFFYNINVSQSILNALAAQKSANEISITKRMDNNGSGFNFMDRSDRIIIIQTLLCMKKIVAELGAKSIRRNSRVVGTS